MIKTEEKKSEKKSRRRFHNMRRLNKHISWLLRDGMLIDRGYFLAFRVVFSAAHLTASLSRVLRESYCDCSYSWLKAQDSVNMPQTGLESRPRLPILISVRQQLSHVFRCQVCGCIILFFLGVSISPLYLLIWCVTWCVADLKAFSSTGKVRVLSWEGHFLTLIAA